MQPQRGWTRRWVSYCCPTAAKPSIIPLGAIIISQDLQEKKRADERTRTAGLLITSEIRVLFRPVHWVQRVHLAPIDKRKMRVLSLLTRQRGALRPARLQYGCSKSGTGESFGEIAHGSRTSGRRCAYHPPPHMLCRAA